MEKTPSSRPGDRIEEPELPLMFGDMPEGAAKPLRFEPLFEKPDSSEAGGPRCKECEDTDRNCVVCHGRWYKGGS